MDRWGSEPAADEVNEMDGVDMLGTEDMSMKVVVDEVGMIQDVLDAVHGPHDTTAAAEATTVPCVVFVG